MGYRGIIKKRLAAFSLVELLVVLAIIGILVLLALPNLMPIISKAKSTEAKLQLGQIHMLEKNYFYEHSKYCVDLQELGFEQEKLVTDNGKANYIIKIVQADEKSFKATATAVVDFDGDGTFNEWEIDQDKNLKENQKD
jgi:prepilin-type N-terminal cleavage/methylation domain